MPKQTTRSKTRRAARALTTAPLFVMIHGGGAFPDDWHKPLVRAIERELGAPFDYLPVYYADVMARVQTRALATPPEKQFKQELRREFKRAFNAARAHSPRMSTRARDRAPAPLQQFSIIAQEVSGYLFDATLRDKIQARLIHALQHATEQSNCVILASLSLGTVVCFDVLKRWAQRYPLALWFTAGSPIAKLRRVGRYDDNLGAIKPTTVAQWHNLYDTTDWIADPLGAAFPKPGYRLHDIFINVGSDPIGSHDYFNNREAIQMFAQAIRAHS